MAPNLLDGDAELFGHRIAVSTVHDWAQPSARRSDATRKLWVGAGHSESVANLAPLLQDVDETSTLPSDQSRVQFGRCPTDPRRSVVAGSHRFAFAGTEPTGQVSYR